MMAPLSLERAFRAVEQVRERLLRAAAALERHGVPYAVIGGHAVAVHVARVDSDAVRNTNDIDMLLDRADWARATVAMADAGFEPAEVQGIPMFLERERPSPRRGVHIIFAGERVRPGDPVAAPPLGRTERAADGFEVVSLRDLIVMKLSANRLKDRVHLQDLHELGMLTPEIDAAIPNALRDRLAAVRRGE